MVSRQQMTNWLLPLLLFLVATSECQAIRVSVAIAYTSSFGNVEKGDEVFSLNVGDGDGPQAVFEAMRGRKGPDLLDSKMKVYFQGEKVTGSLGDAGVHDGDSITCALLYPNPDPKGDQTFVHQRPPKQDEDSEEADEEEGRKARANKLRKNE